MVAPSRRRSPRAAEEEREHEPAARAARGRGRGGGSGKSGPPIVPIAIGGGLLAVVIVALLLMKDDPPPTPPDDGTGTNTAGMSSAGTSAANPSGGATETAAANPSGGATANASDAGNPAARGFDRATFAAQVEAATSALELIALGDMAARDSKDAGDAELAWKQALALEPANAAAKRKLEIRPIDPQADFPGLEEIQGSAQTYLLRPFLKLRGKELSRSERAAEVARWNAERVVIEARVAEASGDPFLTKVDRTRNDLANKPFFENFQYEVIESTRPYALFVELKGDTVTERDARREAVEEAYRPFLAAYDQTIHSYLKPLSPAPPKEEPTFIVFILLDRASYDRFFLEFEGHAGAPGMRAHYTWREKWSFTYSPEVGNPRDPDFGEGTQSLLHELTHAWVDKLATANHGVTYDINLVQTHWFNEGIAEFMSCHFLDGDTIRFQPWKSMRIQELSQRPAGVRIPLEKGFRIGRHDGLEAAAWEVARSQKVVDPGRAAGICMSGFYADMSLFIFWLNYANDRKWKKLFENYVRKEFAGDGGPEVADKIFAGVFAAADLEQQVDAFQKGVADKSIRFEDSALELEK